MNSLAQPLRNALLITRREVRDSLRDWRILGPIIIMTFAFPFLANILAERMIAFVNSFGGGILATRAIPFLLMVVGFFPVSLSLVIALETFVGEKERKSLEPLLSTPLTNWELYVGKTLAAMLPPLLASMGGMLIYLGLVVGGPAAWRPQAILIVQIALLMLVQTLVMVAGAVVVSSQTTSVRAANLLASFVIVPMGVMLQVEAAIVFVAPDFNSPTGVQFLWMMIIVMLVAAVLLLRVGASIFNREELLGRAIDSINIKRILQGIWINLRAVDAAGTPARTLRQMYTHALPYSLSRLKPMYWVGISAFVGAFVFGLMVGQSPEYGVSLPANLLTAEGINQVPFLKGIGELAVSGRLSTFLFGQSLRFMVLALFAGMVTFGVVPVVLNPIMVGALGYFTAVFSASGIPAGPLWLAALPYLLFSVPALVLITTASFRIGALVTRLPEGQTIGQAWSTALGDALKVMILVVIPLLLVSYLVERVLSIPLFNLGLAMWG
jgi:ABC-type transport system involved in multi-copper enzyme maturation permease subunit